MLSCCVLLSVAIQFLSHISLQNVAHSSFFLPSMYFDGGGGCSGTYHSTYRAKPGNTTCWTILLIVNIRITFSRTLAKSSWGHVTCLVNLLLLPDGIWELETDHWEIIFQSTWGENPNIQLMLRGLCGSNTLTRWRRLRRRRRRRTSKSELIRAASQRPSGCMKHWWTW